jgi:hypothetical protein
MPGLPIDDRNYVLQIQLKDISNPNITRTLSVPADLNFHKLHYAIQIAFGWENHHLYTFDIYNHLHNGFGRDKLMRMISKDDWDYCEDGDKESYRWKVKRIFDAYGDKFMEYEYDLGAGWEHSITLIGRAPRNPTIVCLAGEGNGPPEDCGGTCGFEGLKEGVDREFWGDYDPHEWDIGLVSQRLERIEWVIRQYKEMKREEMEEYDN